MFKKSLICAIVPMIFIIQELALSQDTASSKKSSGNKAGAYSEEDPTRDYRIPQLYKRLVAAIKSLKLQPDQEGKLTFVIKSGNYYDLIDRVPRVYHKKALVYLMQDRVNKIVFEYYQYNMTSQVREIKTYTNQAPESDDLKNLLIEYTDNMGEKDKFTVADLQKKNSQADIVSQFYDYYLALVYRLELYKDKTINIESSKIDRTVQMGD
jgi:hypothetical protein